MKIRFALINVLFIWFCPVYVHADAPAQPVTKKYIQQVTYGGEKGGEVFKMQSEYAIQWATHMIDFLRNRAHVENKPLRSYYVEFLGDTDTGHLLDYTPIRLSWHDDIAAYFSDLLKHLDKTDTDHIVHLKSERSHNDLHVVSQDYCLNENDIPFSRDILVNHYKYDHVDLTDAEVKKIAQLEAVSMDELFFGPPNGEIKRDLRILQRQKEALKILKYQMKLKIGDRMIPISIIYGLFQTDQSKPNGVTQTHIDKIKNKSHFIVMHTTKDFIEMLMQVVEGYWEKSILCAHTDVNGIKENLANIFYIQTHAMPYSRGSEAMTKWVLEAVARFHGWTIVYPNGYGFQSPFHSTIDDFVNDFVSSVNFVPYMAPQVAESQQTMPVSQQMMPTAMIPAIPSA